MDYYLVTKIDLKIYELIQTTVLITYAILEKAFIVCDHSVTSLPAYRTLYQ